MYESSSESSGDGLGLAIAHSPQRLDDSSSRHDPGNSSDDAMGLLSSVSDPDEDHGAGLAIDSASSQGGGCGDGMQVADEGGLVSSDTDSFKMGSLSAASDMGCSTENSETTGLSTHAEATVHDEHRPWAEVVLLCLEERLSPKVMRDSLFFTVLALSTSFSGIGCTEIAVQMLVEATFAIYGRRLTWVFRAACEQMPPKISKLLQLVKGDHCIFKDIRDTCKSWDGSFASSKSYDEQCEQIANSDFCNRRQCARHEGVCEFPRVDGEIAGSPCTPWSRMGSRLGRRHKLTHLLVIWCHWLRAMQIPWAIHENVILFDTAILDDILQDMYHIIHIRVNSAAAGEIVSRVRIYSVLLLRGKVRCIADIAATYAFVEKKLASRRKTTVQEYMIANDDDLLAAENGSRQQHKLSKLSTPSGDWGYLLTGKQAQYLAKYEADWHRTRGKPANLCPECVFDLGQNPAKRCVQTSKKGVLPTMRGSGLWWSPMRRRWVLAIEAAYLHGIPLELARQNDYSWKDIGNAMHITSVGSVLSVVLCCTELA